MGGLNILQGRLDNPLETMGWWEILFLKKFCVDD